MTVPMQTLHRAGAQARHRVRIRQSFVARTLPFWLLLPTLLVVLTVQFYPAFYTFFLSTQDFHAGRRGNPEPGGLWARRGHRGNGERLSRVKQFH